MLGSPELLFENPALRGLLAHYEDLRQQNPKSEWFDRLSVFVGVDGAGVSHLYGLLLAHGWLEGRIAIEVLDQPGEVRQAYQISREGRRALTLTQNQFADPEFVSDEGDELEAAA